MKKILYIGGFSMPDGNAAAQRVLAVAKALSIDYSISFLGLTHDENYAGIVDGFTYKNLRYPTKGREWVAHLRGVQELDFVKQINPDIVIVYNFPAVGLYRIYRYCKKHSIIIIGDITEWYHPHNFLKWFDTTLRMRILNKKMDGLIVISRYLCNYYKKQKTFLMPPTVDIEDVKWRMKEEQTGQTSVTDTIKILYAGSPGRGDKDRLDNLVTVIGRFSNLILNVVGIDGNDFHKKYPEIDVPNNVVFYGRQPHDKTIKMLSDSDFSIFFRQSSRVNNAGFPTKFTEAQSAGIPVITSHFSDLGEYIEEGKNGFMAEGISMEAIDVVLEKVSHLSIEDIINMHTYVLSLKRFDYRNYSEQLVRFVKDC